LHLAVDTATFSIRTSGVFLMIAGAILALAGVLLGHPPMIWISIALLAGGLILTATGGWLLRRPAADVQQRMSRSLTLLGLPFEELEQSLSVRVPRLHIDLKRLGTSITLARFRSAARLSRRERLVMVALIKTQKIIRIII
jgi:hypothetical protein